MISKSAAASEILKISRANQYVKEYFRADGSVRHKCFVSYYSEDSVEALSFIESFSDVFIPKAVGVSEGYPWIDSDDDDYVMDTIRDDYLADSTVTIVLVGTCTWSRKFVDWEIYSSLRRDKRNRLNGLLAIQLPSAVGVDSAKLPSRVGLNVVRDNLQTDIGYARYNVYPTSTAALQQLIDDAFNARTGREDLINLGGSRRKANSACT